MFYDAVYHMRILPAHLLRPVPRDQWRTAPFGRQPVGDGPYRFVRWQPAQSIELVADSTFFLGKTGFGDSSGASRPISRFAVQQVIADQADVREQLVTAGKREPGARGETPRRLHLRWQRLHLPLVQPALADDSTKPHPIFATARWRRALAMAWIGAVS